MATKFDALPAWSEVEQDERYQQLDQAGRVTTFDNWFNKLSESAVEEPEVLEGWGEMKKFARAKRVELAGGANPLDVANEEVDAEAEDEPVPARIAAAQRKRELESRITGFMGLGAEQIAKLPEEERDELTKLRSVVTKADEEDLAAIDETAQDDREFHIVDGKFYASPALALSKDKAREAVRNSNLTPKQKADALVEVAQLREQVGAKMVGELDSLKDLLGGAGKFTEFESRYREGDPEATDADVMEAWQKENGGWFDNLGTQIKLGTLRGVSDLVGTYYGAKRLLGDESEQTVALSKAAGELSQQIASGQESVGGATLAGDAAALVTTSLATAPAGPLGRLGVKALQVAGRGGRLAAALTGGKVGKFALDRAARVAAGGATKASVLAREAALRAGGGLAASVFASGVQSAGGSYAQYYDQFLKDAVEDLPVELRQDPEALNIARRSARDAARARAITAGAITALTVFAGTRLFGATGAEKLAQPDVSKAIQAAKEGLAVYFAKTLSKESVGEMTEEGVDALANEIVDKAVVDPNKPISEIIENTLKSAAAGGLLGAGMATPFALRDTWEARARAKQSPEVQQTMQAADNLDAAGAPASAQALRDAVKPQVEAATQEELDAARTKAEADALAALGGEGQPAFEQATAARRRAQDELDALPPDDPAREAAQAKLDELNAVISERGADAMVPVAAAAPTEAVVAPPSETPVDVNDPFGEAPPPAPTESPAAPPAEPTAATVGPQPTPGGVGTPTAPAPKTKGEFLASAQTLSSFTELSGQELNEGTVQSAMEKIRRDGYVEPLTFTYDPKTGLGLLSDGNHRLEAAKRLGFTQVPVLMNRQFAKYEGSGKGKATTVAEAGASISEVKNILSSGGTPPAVPPAASTQAPAPNAPSPLASPVKTPPKPTPPQADDTQTKESQTSSLPAVSGQPAGQVGEGQAATGAAPRASQGKADAGKKLTAVEETPQAKAEAIIREEMFKNSVIPSSATTTTRFKQLTKKGFSKGSPELKALQDRLRKAWEEAHPPEDVAPAGYFVGSTEGPEMKPLPKTVVRGSRAADNAGGAIPFKLVGGERVGLFTNNPVITAKQINAGLKIIVPPNLRSKVAKGIEIDPTTGQVTAAYDYSRGNTPVTKAGDWTALYKASSSRQERAENLLKEGENIAEKTGKTVEQVTEELRQVTNVVNAITAGKKKVSPAVFAEVKELHRELVKQVVAMTKSQNPRIPFVGTDAYLSQYAPDEVAGESAILKEYLQLRAPVKGEDSYVGAIVRNTVKLNWPRLSDSDMLERMEFAIKNVATIKVRQSLLRNPDATPEAVKASLRNIIGVANDVINKFAAADRAYRSAITGSIDDELSESDRVIAGVAVAAAQVDAEAQVTRLDAGDVASVPLTDAEAERLQTALQSMNDGVPDTVAFEILQARPLQARKALQSVASKLKFKVGSDGELIYEHGPALKEEESQALVDILKNVGPEGDTELLDRLSSLPNVARFFLDMAALGREALQKVKTPAGANMYTAKELRNMNLIGIFTAVHAGDSSTAARILKQARQNLDTYSDSASKTSAHVNKILKFLLAPSSQAPSVKGRAAPASAVAERRAQEKLGTQQALVEAARGAVNFNNLEMERLTNSIRTLSDRRDELRDDLKKPNVDITKTQRELNKVNGALSRVQENYTLTEMNLADAKASLEAAVKVYESMVSKLAPPAAAVVEQTKAEVDAAVKAAEEAGDAQRRLETSPAPTKAVNAGMTAAFENPTPVNTEEEKSLFKSELSALGLGAEADVETTLNILRQMSLKGGANAGYTKFLSRMFSDNPALLNGIDGVQVVDLPVLAEDVSIVNGLLTLNVAAMTKTLDGTPRGPEALLRGLVTHAVTNLTSMGIPLTTTQQAALTKLEELRQEAAAMEPLTRAPGLAPRFTDALKDTASFVQAVLTSPEFADMLRSYRTKKVPGIKSAWGRFWAAVGEFLTGKKVDFSSGLHVSLMTAGDLMVRSPSAAKSFLDTLKAVIHNPDIAFPKGRTAGAEEINHQQRVNEAVELADSPDTLDTVEARLTGDNSPEADPENVSELDAALMPSDAILGSAPVTEPKGTSRVKRAPKVRKEKPAAAPLLTEREAFAGLADAILTVRWVDRVARGVVTMSEAAKATSLDVPRAMDKLAAAVERLKASSAANKDEFIKKLEDMQAFLGSERERVMAGEAPASPAPDPVSTVAEDVETDALPAESDIPLAEVDEDAIPFAEPYIEATADDGSKQPIDFNPFLRAAAIKTGRRIAMVEAGPGVMNQPLYVRHDRTDSRIYMNKEAMTELIERLRSEGYTTAESTTYINALLDREASTLAILQRFSDGELLATARSLSDDQRRQIIDRVYGLKPGDKGYSNYFSVGRSGYSQEVTADMIQLGADYFRMMRQVSETGHTSEDVMYMAAASMGTFARTVAFLKATANQFATWWRAYGDVNATRAILNIDEFLLAVTPSVGAAAPLAAPAKKIQKHEATALVANLTGRTVEEVLADAQMMQRVRESMKQHVVGGDRPDTKLMTNAEARKFVKSLGLVNRDPGSIAVALTRIADMGDVNPAFRAIARELSQSPKIKSLADLQFVVSEDTYKIQGKVVSAAGMYDPSTNVLSMDFPFLIPEFAANTNPDSETIWSQASVMETLLHEAVHAATTLTVNAYKAGEVTDPEVKAAVEGLIGLWKSVLNQKGADQFSYELSNLDEFITGVSTDPNFVAWLASLPPSVGADVPGETGSKSMIKRILRRIYKIIFPQLKEDNVLQKSLDRVFDLAAYPHLAKNPRRKELNSIYRYRLGQTALRRKRARQASDEAMGLIEDETDYAEVDMAAEADDFFDDEGPDPEEMLAREAEEMSAKLEAMMDKYTRRTSLALPFPVYHGTPHKVARFLMSKIGTGEGNQAFGYGLYFAQKKEVAGDYRLKLTQLDAVRRASKVAQEALAIMAGQSQSEAANRAQQNLQALQAKYDDFRTGRAGYTVSNEAEYLEELRAGVKFAEEVWDLVRTPRSRWSESVMPKAAEGYLYTVEILPDDEEFLDWDKPLSQQSEKVRQALDRQFSNLGDALPSWMQEGAEPKDPSGQDIYKMIVKLSGGSYQSASQKLAEAGVPGIRYLDEGSRDAGDGTRNYVVFNEDFIKITEENGKPVNMDSVDSVLYPEAGRSGVLASPVKLPPRMLPGKVTGERKATEALKNSLPAMPTRVEEYLGESTYFSGVPKRDIEIIESLIGPRLAGATGSPEFSQIAYDIERGSLPLTDPQRFLAQVVLGNALNKRIFDLQKALVDSPTSGGVGMLEDYEQLAKDVWRSVQEVASTSGQMLHAAAVARDLINPRFISATYRDNLSTMAKKGLPKDVGDVFTDLKKEADAVSSDVVKKSPLTKKIVEAMTKATGSNPAEVQLLFDFMETLPVKILQDYRNRGTGIPIPAKMASWVADRIFNMVESKVRAQVKQVADAAGEPEQTFFEEYSNEVKRLVAVRVNDALAGVAPARQGLTPAEQEAADREALDSAIRKLVSSFEYLPSVENALNQSRAKLLSHLEAKKGSTPEALKQYEASKAAIAAMKFDLVPLSTATDIIRRSFDMREQVYLSLADQRASVVQIATMISNSAGLTEDQSRKVAEAFKAAYEAEMNRRIQKTLNSYAQRRLRFEGRGGAERYSRSERFLRLARIGGLRQEEFYNAMATEFGLPSYDPAVAKELEQEAERILAMPVGSVQRNDATRELNARIVNETYRSLLDAYGAKAVVKNKEMFWDYLAGVPVAMWKSGVLSGFGTSEVNFGFGTVQSIMDLGFNATAYAVKAKDPTLAASNVLTLMRAVGWIADPLQRKEVWTEIKRAALTGRTRFASEQSENMLVLERDIPSIDLPVIKQLMGSAKNFYKLLGRIGSVVDATVSVPASIARQRLAMQYALTMSGADRAKIKEVLRSSFTPDEMESREINQILDAEREQFRNSPRPDLAMESRRFQLLEQRRAQTYAELTSRLEAKDKEDFMDASRESARFANLGTTPAGLSGLVFDGVFGSIERKFGGLSSIIVSFPRAMGNLLDFSLAMSVPGLSFMRANNTSPSSWLLSEDSRYRREMVEKGSIKYWKLMAQGIVALAAQATIGVLYYYGLEDEEEGRVPWFMVYGKGYPDSERNRQLRYRQPNWSPYTVKIGGVYLSWKDIPGFNLLLGGLASMTDDRMVTSLKDPKKIRKVEAMANASIAFIKAVTVKNSLQGLAQAGELLSDNAFAEAMTVTNAGKLLTNFVSGATNPRLLRDVASMGRGLVGGGEYTLKDTRGLTAAAISLLPANEVYGASLGQHDMLNSLGEPVTNFWFAPLTKRILPVTAGPSTDPIITPLVSAGLFLSPVKASQMSFDTYEDGSDNVDTEGGPLSSFDPEVEIDAIKMFGEQMRLRMTPDYIKELTDLAAEGQAGRKEAQERLNKECADARAYAKDIIQERIFNREIKPHWQE